MQETQEIQNNTVNFKIETTNISNIYDNLINSTAIKSTTNNNFINNPKLTPPYVINTFWWSKLKEYKKPSHNNISSKKL